MRIAVTGAAGFIGSNLVETLLNQGHQLVAIDALIDTTYPKDIKIKRWESLRSNPGVELINVDMRYGNLESLFNELDVIYHLAAMPGLLESWSNFEQYSSCNITATQRLLDSISNLNQKPKLLHISTSSVYGRIADGNEESPTNPFSPYGVTKLAAENLVKAYASNFGLDFNILRYFSVYGPNQRPDMAYSKFINAIHFGHQIALHGDGRQSRTNTYVGDCVDATIAIAEKGFPGSIYNIAGVDEIDMLSVIKLLEKIMGKTAIISFLPVRAGDQAKTRGNIDQLKNDTGFSPTVGIADGLENQVKAFFDSLD